MSIFLRIILFCSVIFSSIAIAAPLTPIEKQIANYIVTQQDPELTLLEKLVNINSGTMNIEGGKQVGKILQEQFNQLGFTTHWSEEPADLHRNGTLFAERKGNNGKRLLLIGHLDTVFPQDSLFQRFEKRDSIASGPGVIDDKGGDIVILYALKALQEAHALDNTTIIVALVGDEENSGKPTSISRKTLIDAARQSDIALDFEFSLDIDTATIARRGISNWALDTQGKELHSASIFQKDSSDGAIYELARILNTIREQFAGKDSITINPGAVVGGTKITFDKNNSQGTAFGKENVIAQTALVTGDFRFISNEQKKATEDKIQTIVSQHLLGTHASLHFEDAIPAMPPSTANMQLLEKYSAASVDLGFGAIKPLGANKRGAGDISHVASFVSASLSGLGPTGSGAHSEKEELDIRTLPIATARAAILIYRLTH